MFTSKRKEKRKPSLKPTQFLNKLFKDGGQILLHSNQSQARLYRVRTKIYLQFSYLVQVAYGGYIIATTAML